MGRSMTMHLRGGGQGQDGSHGQTPPEHGHGADHDDGHRPSSGGGGHGAHGGHGGHGGHGDHAAMFRTRFWWSLLLTVPVVATSHMIMDWFGYELSFYGIEWVGPVLGTVLFLWGGWPFLSGGVAEARAKQPGMMLLIAMAITVAYAASMGRRSTGSTSTSGGSWRP